LVERKTALVSDQVATAVATLVIHDHKILLGKRIKNGVFEGWQCPGGYLLSGETLEDASKRICLQKTGLEIEFLQTGPYTNNIFSEMQPVKHTVTLYLLVHLQKQINAESVKAGESEWFWFAAEKMPEPLFKPLKLLQEQCEIAQLISV